MAHLVVRNLDHSIVEALKHRAAVHGRSAEAEHRLILEQVLLHSPKRSFAEVLASMPDVGRDSDFQRAEATEAQTVYLIDTNVVSEARKAS
ncbi:MAG: DNA-binding protein [Thiocapsa sp.]|uniref:FitA-like ribbon-helix-helix domain-containing protein n=1 Tax=Thiocapsa sp. TaxID=2024551 RepID=UPI001BCC256E|nr:DNA-binding protein [Thiocapsa sp.]QVL47164.1 MAG: DNA-binding protein [Thiocapsa sp.]